MAKEKTNDLANLIKDSINKNFKDRKVAYFLSDQEAVTGWIPTGSEALNLAISNQKYGGWPRGKIVELMGLEASGKSLLAAHAIKSTQDMGGIGVYIDTEFAYHIPFLEAIGVDIEKMVYVELNILEDIYQTIDDILIKISEETKGKDVPVTIVFDSQSGAVAKNEAEGDYDKEGWNTDKAIVNSKAMRKITRLIGRTKALLIVANQLRVKLGVSFGDPYCVDPETTVIKIRSKSDFKSWDKGYKGKKFKEEELTIREFSDRFANNDDFTNPEEFDINPEYECEILGHDLKNRKDVYKPITRFVIKNPVKEHYFDGLLKCSSNHKIWNKEIREWEKSKNHPDFKLVKEKMNVVDFEVDGIHNYYANGRLNHNTTSGGHAIGFHASVRLRLKQFGQIKGKVNGVEQVIGITTLAQVKKNRVGPNLKKIKFNVFYDTGINDYENWLDILKEYSLIKQGGAWYTWTDLKKNDKKDLPIEYKFQKKNFQKLITEDHPHLEEQIYDTIADTMIMQYKSSELDEEDIKIVENADSDFADDVQNEALQKEQESFDNIEE